MKIFARQIAPEHQESPFSYLRDDYLFQGVIIDGNKQYYSHTTKTYDIIKEEFNNGLDIHEYIGKVQPYKTITEAIQDIFPPQHKAKYSTIDIAKWKKLFDCNIPTQTSKQTSRQASNAGYWQEKKDICTALKLMTGKSYNYACIRGVMQSEWQYIYYPDKIMGESFAKQFEAEYFNTGSEWIIHEVNDDVNLVELDEGSFPTEFIESYSAYCYEWSDEEIRKEIASHACCEPSDVVMYKFEGYSRQPKYSISMAG